MPNRSLPDRGYDGSFDRLNGIQLGHGPMRRFLEEYAWRDTVRVFDDFAGDTLWTDLWAAAASGTGVAFNQTTVAVGGTAIATTANLTGASVSLVGPTIWKGDHNAIMEARLKVSTATSNHIEVGWTPLVPGSSNPVVTTPALAPTIGVTDAAILALDTTASHTSFAFCSIGSFTSQTAVATLITAATHNTIAPTAGVFFTVRIAMLTDPDETGKTKLYCWLNDRLVASHDTAAAGRINGQILLAPWIYYKTIAAAQPTIEVDYIRVKQDRIALMGASE